MTMGLIMLAGGKSLRMGQDKAQLQWQGKTFLETLLHKAQAYGFEEIIIAAGANSVQDTGTAVVVVEDSYQDCGPLGGLQAALRVSRSDYLLTLSCDMPLLQLDFLTLLKTAADGKNKAVVPLADGRIQPLSALYHRDCMAPIESLLQGKKYRMTDLLGAVKTKYVAVMTPKSYFFNVNKPADLVVARAKAVNQNRRIPMVTVAAARSGTGKTTLIAGLLPLLTRQGLRVAVIKSDGHDFSLDQEGKDTQKFTQAGAAAVAIVAPMCYAIMAQTTEKKSLEAIAHKLEDVDLILVETRARGLFPVMELLREGCSDTCTTPPEKLAAIIGDKPYPSQGVYQFRQNDLAGIVTFIQAVMGYISGRFYTRISLNFIVIGLP